MCNLIYRLHNFCGGKAVKYPDAIALFCSLIYLHDVYALDKNFHTKKGQLGVYHLMIVSKYFKTIDDFKNLELATPKAYGNMEKFRFNPISLTKDTIKFFTHLETLHVYNKDDDHFTNRHFWKRVIWYAKDINKLQSEPMGTVFKRFKINNACIEHIRYNISNHTVTISRDNINDKGVDIGLDKIVQLVIISPSIVHIGKRTFNCCTDLQDIIIPNSITRISQCAFSECLSLKKVNLPTKLSKISDRTFFKCTSLTSIYIPSSVEIIEECAFQSCVSLPEIDIPNTVTSIAKSAFSGCRSLSKVTLPNSITCLEDHIFRRCYSLKELIIPESVVKISKGCFFECNSLTEINIPKLVTKIGELSFTRCYSLIGITLERYVNNRNDKYRLKRLIADLSNCGNARLMCTIYPPLKKKHFGSKYYFE